MSALSAARERALDIVLWGGRFQRTTLNDTSQNTGWTKSSRTRTAALSGSTGAR